ncbi:MAG: hypothetical protein R8K47_08560 [Mariprofundaceae bacterium]
MTATRLRFARQRRFARDVLRHTPVVKMLIWLILLWLLFSAALYLAERDSPGSSISSYGQALYWGVAAFSTAGIADKPVSGMGAFVGGLWIITGSLIFFGSIVATVTAYFNRPLQRPAHQIIDTIEYNLEQLGDLTIEELELLKQTVDSLIEHMERVKSQMQRPD